MSALSRGLISRLRLFSPGIQTGTPSFQHLLLRRFGSEPLLDEVSDENRRVIEAKSGVMRPDSRRTGLIAVKCGMTALWDKWGERVPISVLWVDDNIVSQVKTIEKEGITALQVRFWSICLSLKGKVQCFVGFKFLNQSLVTTIVLSLAICGLEEKNCELECSDFQLAFGDKIMFSLFKEKKNYT